MKTLHVVIGLAAVGGAAYWYSQRSTAAKAAASPAPSTSGSTGTKTAAVTAAIKGVVDIAGNLWGTFSGKTTTSSSSAPAPAPTTVRASDRPPTIQSSGSMQPQL